MTHARRATPSPRSRARRTHLLEQQCGAQVRLLGRLADECKRDLAHAFAQLLAVARLAQQVHLQQHRARGMARRAVAVARARLDRHSAAISCRGIDGGRKGCGAARREAGEGSEGARRAARGACLRDRVVAPRLVALEFGAGRAVVGEGRRVVAQQEGVVGQLEHLRLDRVGRVPRQLAPRAERHDRRARALAALLAAEPRAQLVLQPLPRRLDRRVERRDARLQVRDHLAAERLLDVRTHLVHAAHSDSTSELAWRSARGRDTSRRR
eukprot:7052010-Prymnesium_polylepis.1